MTFFRWSSRFSVGVAAFDREHVALIDMINDLHEAMRAGKGKEVLDAVLVKLFAYTVNHFEHEEIEMSKHGYPLFREHCAQHQNLRQTVHTFRNRLSIGNNGLIAIDMAGFLKSWLEQHILREDMRYGRFLNDRGVC